MFTSAQSVEWNGARLLRAFMPLVDSGEVGAVHVAMTGKWAGHDAGEFEITEDVIDQIIGRFEAQANPMPVDYEHQSMDKTPGPKVAAGWIQSLTKRSGENGPELWATVEWTDEAAGYIKSGAYKFCSPVIDFAATDRITGEEVGPEMFNLALTNNPFLDGQKPIQLKRIQFMDKDVKTEMMDEPKTELMDEDEPKEMMDEEEHEMGDEPTEVDFNAFGKSLADSIGQDEAATLAHLTDSVERIAEMINAALNTGTGGDGTVTDAKRMSRIEADAKDGELVALRKQVEELTADKESREAREREAVVEAKIAEGYILPDQKDDAVWLLSQDAEKFARIYANKQVPVGDTQAGDEAANEEDVTASDLTEREQRTLVQMKAAQISEEKAIRKIVALRKGSK